MTTDVMATKRTTVPEGVVWLLVNAFGIAIYLAFESWILAPRTEEEAFNGIDEIGYWLEFNLPVLLVCLVLNIIWLIRIRRHRQPSTKWPFRIWLLMCLAWSIGLFIMGSSSKF